MLEQWYTGTVSKVLPLRTLAGHNRLQAFYPTLPATLLTPTNSYYQEAVTRTYLRHRNQSHIQEADNNRSGMAENIRSDSIHALFGQLEADFQEFGGDVSVPLL
jgi:hypothetical protein